MSLSELAERAGIAKSYLSSIERNIQSNPSIQFLEKISSVLDIPVNSLLQGDNSEMKIWIAIGKHLYEKQWIEESQKTNLVNF